MSEDHDHVVGAGQAIRGHGLPIFQQNGLSAGAGEARQDKKE